MCRHQCGAARWITFLMCSYDIYFATQSIFYTLYFSPSHVCTIHRAGVEGWEWRGIDLLTPPLWALQGWMGGLQPGGEVWDPQLDLAGGSGDGWPLCRGARTCGGLGLAVVLWALRLVSGWANSTANGCHWLWWCPTVVSEGRLTG